MNCAKKAGTLVLKYIKVIRWAFYDVEPGFHKQDLSVQLQSCVFIQHKSFQDSFAVSHYDVIVSRRVATCRKIFTKPLVDVCLSCPIISCCNVIDNNHFRLERRRNPSWSTTVW